MMESVLKKLSLHLFFIGVFVNSTCSAQEFSQTAGYIGLPFGSVSTSEITSTTGATMPLPGTMLSVCCSSLGGYGLSGGYSVSSGTKVQSAFITLPTGAAIDLFQFANSLTNNQVKRTAGAICAVDMAISLNTGLLYAIMGGYGYQTAASSYLTSTAPASASAFIINFNANPITATSYKLALPNGNGVITSVSVNALGQAVLAGQIAGIPAAFSCNLTVASPSPTQLSSGVLTGIFNSCKINSNQGLAVFVGKEGDTAVLYQRPSSGSFTKTVFSTPVEGVF